LRVRNDMHVIPPNCWKQPRKRFAARQVSPAYSAVAVRAVLNATAGEHISPVDWCEPLTLRAQATAKRQMKAVACH
jgi:hypothetical protein